jgi:hypothetical protein
MPFMRRKVAAPFVPLVPIKEEVLLTEVREVSKQIAEKINLLLTAMKLFMVVSWQEYIRGVYFNLNG